MTQTHTPGPWRVSTSGNVVADLPNGDHLFIAYPKHPEQPTVESPMRDANAALIAAAPDLLAEAEANARFLEQLAAHLEANAMPGQAGNCTIRAKATRAAIAKAEGRS